MKTLTISRNAIMTISTKINRYRPIPFLFALLAPSLFAATSVTVQMRDEALSETNISKPRIYITNTGDVTLTDFIYYYYFTTEGGKTPVIEDYYTPECNVSLEQQGTDSYRLRYQVTGASLAPGASLPDASGNIIGLHYNDWSAWTKTNDYSNNQSATFAATSLIPLYVNGTLIAGTEPAGSGGSLTREVWTGISGSAVSAIPVTTPFNSTGAITSFEEPQSQGDNFGTRIRGYLTAPTTGAYTFWIAGDDCCELRLSSNDRPENKSTIASVNGYTGYREWGKYPSQKSSAITLTSGQRYYVEALHKEAGGGDNCSVGWARPGQGTSAPSEVVPGGVLTPFPGPNATPSLSGSLASPTQINLSWTNPCTNEDGYRIERSVSSGSYSLLTETGVNATSYQNTGLTANTTYSYRVRAFNSQGSSAWSNTITLTTQEATSGSVVRELWTGVSGGYVSDIPLGNSPNSTSTLTLLQGPTNSADNYGARVRGYITAPTTGSYTFWISADDRAEFWLSTDNTPANTAKIAYVPSYNLNPLDWNANSGAQKSAAKSLTAGQKYYFEVLHKEAGGGDHVAVGWAKPGQGTTSPSEIVPGSVLSRFILPVAPSNLVATALSGSSLSLTWSDNSDNEESFSIEQSLDGTNFTSLTSKSANSTSHTVTGLSPGTTYWFRIKASNGAGASDWSNVASATTQASTTGAITRDVWTGITGGSVSAIPVDLPPNSTGTITSLDAPRNWADNYGERLRGYLTPPSDGPYTFWICGDDNCELWLSTGADPENPAGKNKIAFVNGYTGVSEWNKYPTDQKSAAITLSAGQRYYIEVLHKESGGSDHVMVGWLKPGESGTVPSEIVSGAVLSAFTAPVASSALAATPVSSTQIDLSWSDNSDNETGFTVEWGLASGAFTETQSVDRNVTSFSALTLTPNTQYQFRVKATNYAGASAYTSVVTAITNAPGDQPGPVLTPELLSFAIYSEEQTLVGSRSIFSGGGAVGSNTFVKAEPDAKIYGSIVCGGNVELRDRDTVSKDVTCVGTLVQGQNVSIGGTVTEGASVTRVDIPEVPPLTIGMSDITANSGETVPIAPGTYRNCTVNPGGTIIFSAGSYIFGSLVIGNDATAKFNVAMDQSIDINVESTLEFRDRATAEFEGRGYAPCVRIYTNATSFNIGCDVHCTGIIIAPHAATTIFSRTRIGGALYAKRINIEPDAVVASDFVNPVGDHDNDSIPNFIELLLTDAPDDSDSYSIIAVPDPVIIDNSSDMTVLYDFGIKLSEYGNSRSVPITYPDNSLLKPNIPPVIQPLNLPPDPAIPQFSDPGYLPIGCYHTMRLNSIANDRGTFEIGLPLPLTAIPSAAERRIAWYNTGTNTWRISPSGRAAFGAIYGRVSQATCMIIVEKANSNSAVLYLDAGEIYTSTSGFAGIDTKISLSGISASTSGSFVLSPKSVAGTPLPTKPLTLEERGGYLVCSDSNRLDYQETVIITDITITTSATDTLRFTCNDTVRQGQTITYYADRSMRAMKLATIRGNKLSGLYNPATLQFESMAFSEGVIKKTPPAVPTGSPTWFYHYYLRDHLGSTRMVVKDDGTLVEATMYQPYGTMEAIASGSEAVRERFTGKELDKDGKVGAAPGMGLVYFEARYYDPDIGVWTAIDPAGQFYSPYAYASYNKYGSTNPLLFVDADGKFGPLTHLFSGGWGDMMVDFENKYDNYNLAKYKWFFVSLGLAGAPFIQEPTKQQKQWAHEAHGAYETKEKLVDFLKRPDVPDQYKRHAIDDYYNQGEHEIGKCLTWDEWLVQKIWNTKTRQDYQDSDLGWLINSPGKIAEVIYLRYQEEKMMIANSPGYANKIAEQVMNSRPNFIDPISNDIGKLPFPGPKPTWDKVFKLPKIDLGRIFSFKW